VFTRIEHLVSERTSHSVANGTVVRLQLKMRAYNIYKLGPTEIRYSMAWTNWGRYDHH